MGAQAPEAGSSEQGGPAAELEPLVEPELVGDRPFTGRRVPLSEPRSLLGPWVKVIMLVLALIGILVFHQTMSHQVAGCYQEVATAPGAGLDADAETDLSTKGTPPKPTSPFANEVEIQLRPKAQPSP